MINFDTGYTGAYPFFSSSEGHLFFNGEEIKNFVIPNSITSINPHAFYKCTGLEKITIPSSITTIGEYAFYGCIGLEDIIIPSSVEEVNSEVFNGCTNLTEVMIEDGETELSLSFNDFSGRTNRLGKGLFYDCPIITLYIGRNLSYTDEMHCGYSPFYGIKTIKEVTLGNHVTKIENYLFGLCSGLESVTIPSSVTSIGNNVFQDCTSLTNLTIPYSVISIGNSVFSGCTGLTTLYSLNNIPPSIGTDNFSNNHYMTLNVYVPQEALTAYQNAEIWKDLWNLQGFEYTGIEKVKANNQREDKYYDLRGNRLSAPKRGLNIINGKKVIMK